MKKWITLLLLLAFFIGETSCVVRVRKRTQPEPSYRRAVISQEKASMQDGFVR